jgi:hypothetical protein
MTGAKSKVTLSDLGALRETLRPLTSRYNWFASADIALQNPIDFMMRVMDLCTFEDLVYIEERIAPEVFIEALKHARVGDFRPKSWWFWHYRLRLTEPGLQPPAQPTGRTYA